MSKPFGMSKPLGMSVPLGFQSSPLDFIHRSSSRRENPDPWPHLTGTLNGKKRHLSYCGQTTLGMFDDNLPGKTLKELQGLETNYPELFKNSGFKLKKP